MSEEEMLDIIDRIIRYKSLTYFGYNTNQVGYEALEKIVEQYKKQQKEIEKLKSFINLGNLEEMYILLNAKTSECEDIRNERDRALKVIDNMANYIFDREGEIARLTSYTKTTVVSKDQIKECFYKEIENE